MFKKRLRQFWYWIARSACRLFCISFFDFRVYGLDNIPDKGPFILASNHQSYLDPVLCGIALKRQLYYLARDTLFTNRFFKWLTFSLNTIPLRRGEADVSAIKTVIHKLEQGEGVCLYPEGTRTSDGRIALLKAGFGLLCRRGNAPLIPMVIDGAFECWPRDKNFFSRGSITLYYGKAIHPKELKQISNRQIATQITDILRRMQSELRRKLGKQPLKY